MARENRRNRAEAKSGVNFKRRTYRRDACEVATGRFKDTVTNKGLSVYKWSLGAKKGISSR